MSRSTARSAPYPKLTPAKVMPPSDLGERRRARVVADGGPLVDDLEDADHGPGTLLELAVDAGDGAQARADGDAVQQEAGQRAQRQAALDDEPAGVPEDDDERPEAEERHHGAEEPAGRDEAGGRAHDAAQVLVVALPLPRLAPERLDDADAAEGLLRGGGAGGDGVLDLRAQAPQGPREDHGHDDEGRRQGQDDDEQRWG